MKKLLNKLKNKKDLPPVSRITSETMAEHREMILAGGRRFKYPIQYARHKLVINAILISIAALILVLALGFWQLYSIQNTSEFMSRVTKVIPVPVATVDGQPVLYSDYLMKYLSFIHHLEKNEQMNPKTDSGRQQIEYFKQQSMQSVIEDAYALKLSKKLGISVSEDEVEAFILQKRNSVPGGFSQVAFDTSISDVLGLSPSDYRHLMRGGLILEKVSYKLDKGALSTINSIDELLKNDKQQDFKKLATDLSTREATKVIYGMSGWVSKDNQDGGLALTASKLQKAEASSIIKSTLGTSGYYIVRLLDVNDKQVNYEYINVPLTAFIKSLDKITAEGKVKKYISMPDSSK